MRRTSATARAAALLSLGGLVLHQVRYSLAYGHDASRALAEQGHGYLSETGAALATLAVATILAGLLGAALARAGKWEGGRGPTFRRTAPYYALALMAIFSAQELTEGALAAGHPGGVAAVLAHGGWIAVPLALAIGAVCSVASLALAEG